jgi:hypothetical protein
MLFEAVLLINYKILYGVCENLWHYFIKFPEALWITVPVPVQQNYWIMVQLRFQQKVLPLNTYIWAIKNTFLPVATGTVPTLGNRDCSYLGQQGQFLLFGAVSRFCLNLKYYI